jgi:hypothetical protein
MNRCHSANRENRKLVTGEMEKGNGNGFTGEREKGEILLVKETLPSPFLL